MKIYISGKITGDHKWRYKFVKAKRELQERYPDAEILSPLDAYNSVTLNVKKPTERNYLFSSLRLLILQATHIHFLPDWQESEGARAERIIANKLNIEKI